MLCCHSFNAGTYEELSFKENWDAFLLGMDYCLLTCEETVDI